MPLPMPPLLLLHTQPPAVAAAAGVVPDEADAAAAAAAEAAEAADADAVDDADDDDEVLPVALPPLLVP